MKRIFFAVSMLLSMNAHSAGWTQPLEVATVYVNGNGNIYASTIGGSVYTAGCREDVWHLSSSNQNGENRMYTALMTAATSGKKISFFYKDSCGDGDYHASSYIKFNAN